MKRFLNYLDNHRKIEEMTPQMYYNMMYQVNCDYMFNNIQNTNISGGVDSLFLMNSKDDSYETWQNMHEATIHIEDTDMYPIKKTKYVSIEFTINSIKDLIELTNKHSYHEDTDYNIDLKSIHNIKSELIEIDDMIGMENLKRSILDQLIYFIQKLHIGSVGDYKHTVLYGPPGTGKTEIAKIIGRMYSKIGVLKKSIFKKVTRTDLVAGYLGQTAIKTQKVIDDCMGGVLFIDEAYSLANSNNGENDNFSKECIDTLCEALSNHKDDFMVIIAGYENELNSLFFKANTGLESRFIWRFKMDEYKPNEMYKIFVKKVLTNKWSFLNEEDITEKWFEKNKGSFIYFGRDMENLFTYTKIAHGRRVYGKPNECHKKIILEDLENGFLVFKKNSKKKEDAPTFISDMYV